MRVGALTRSSTTQQAGGLFLRPRRRFARLRSQVFTLLRRRFLAPTNTTRLACSMQLAAALESILAWSATAGVNHCWPPAWVHWVDELQDVRSWFAYRPSICAHTHTVSLYTLPATAWSEMPPLSPVVAILKYPPLPHVVVHEFWTSQYAWPPSVPYPMILIAWPPSSAPVLCT